MSFGSNRATYNRDLASGMLIIVAVIGAFGLFLFLALLL